MEFTGKNYRFHRFSWCRVGQQGKTTFFIKKKINNTRRTSFEGFISNDRDEVQGFSAVARGQGNKNQGITFRSSIHINLYNPYLEFLDAARFEKIPHRLWLCDGSQIS
jgi:hypothetical protein